MVILNYISINADAEKGIMGRKIQNLLDLSIHVDTQICWVCNRAETEIGVLC